MVDFISDINKARLVSHEEVERELDKCLKPSFSEKISGHISKIKKILRISKNTQEKVKQ